MEQNEGSAAFAVPDGEKIPGYTKQSEVNLTLFRKTKEVEERLLRFTESMAQATSVDPRWMAIAVTHFQQGFMALLRSIAQPQRIRLPGEGETKENDDAELPGAEPPPASGG